MNKLDEYLDFLEYLKKKDKIYSPSLQIFSDKSGRVDYHRYAAYTLIPTILFKFNSLEDLEEKIEQYKKEFQ